MKLKIMERLVVFGVLPTSASFATWKTLRALKRVLTLTEDEKKEVGFTVSEDQTQYKWDPEKDIDREFVISGEGLKIIQDGFKKLDSTGQLTEQQATVMERFMDVKAEV